MSSLVYARRFIFDTDYCMLLLLQFMCAFLCLMVVGLETLLQSTCSIHQSLWGGGAVDDQERGHWKEL